MKVRSATSFFLPSEKLNSLILCLQQAGYQVVGPVIADQTISANGNYFYSVTGRPVKYIRPVFVSEAGGTAATVDFVVAAL